MENIKNYLLNYSNQNIVLFGASLGGKDFIKKYSLDNIIYICDNDPNKWGSFIEGYKVIPPAELQNMNKDVYVIITSFYYESIIPQLIELGFEGKYDLYTSIYDRIDFELADGYKKSERVKSMLEDDKSAYIYSHVLEQRLNAEINYKQVKSENKPYFFEDFIEYGDGEVYVDAGATGESSFDFMEATNNNYEKIYCFEPEQENYLNLEKDYLNRKIPKDKYELLNSGIFSENKAVKLYVMGQYGDREGSTVYNTFESANIKTQEIQLVRLDDVIKGKVTFIKMDIEGSEYEALKGAETLIKTYKPKLAICIYHRIEDYFEIPLLIKALNNDYKFYIRHFQNDFSDTVVFAI